MLKLALSCVQSRQSLLCSRTCTKWVFILHILSVNAQTSISMRAVSPEPSLLSRMHKMGAHMAYSISECSDAPERTYSLTRSFTALAHAQKWADIYDIFFQPMLRLEDECMQSCQSLHCSRTCTKWVYTWHIPSVNAQTRLNIHAVSPEPSLHSRMQKMGVHMAYFISEC